MASCLPPQRRQRIFDMGRHDRVGDAIDQTVRFEILQRLREHPFADAIDPPPQFAEPECAVFQHDQDQHGPATGDVPQNVPRGAGPGEDIAATQLFGKRGVGCSGHDMH